ncbi:SCO family protein [Hyphomicrobium sp. CS1BSMeth3]|uniref:SCO family protein n=1 Tax=Hyphomicrobium sp. CS1BSMeth3 TaxID=1892844 RepID=UPI0009302544|nr:SCO family protein [Hyphomicrobium sp. CS1BSMeth3]
MNFRLAAIALTATLLGGLVALVVLPGPREQVTRALPSTGKALVGGPFSLVDQTGKAVTDKDFRGRFMLVYFGFTNCPDICPSGLQVMSAALDKLGPKADQVTPILITVDPERDTPQQLASYVPSFHPRLVGLTGSPEQIAAALKAYRVYAKKVEDPKSSAGFTYDHTSIIYLMDREGNYVAHFTHATSVDRIAERLAQVL